MHSPSTPRRRAAARTWRRAASIGATALLFAGCNSILLPSPEPTPLDFPAIAGELAKRGVQLDRIASGDAGCADPTLTGTAIGVDASGLGMEAPVRLRIYIFRNADAFDRRRADVDACAATWATDPATFELVDAKPFVLAGQGPWTDEFKAAIREALTVSAGNGG